MSVEAHITRRKDIVDSGDDITFAEWRAYVEASTDLRPAGFFPVSKASDEAMRKAPIEAFEEVAFFDHLIQGAPCWFSYQREGVVSGIISVTGPDDAVMKRMHVAAKALDGFVRDDDGLSYDENGEPAGY